MVHVLLLIVSNNLVNISRKGDDCNFLFFFIFFCIYSLVNGLCYLLFLIMISHCFEFIRKVFCHNWGCFQKGCVRFE